MKAGRRTAGALGLLAAAALGAILIAGLVPNERPSENGPTALLTLFGIHLGSLPQLHVGQRAPEFPSGEDVAWLNTAGSSPGMLRGKPLSLRELNSRGKVVLVHFWDYTSIESLRSLEVVSHMHKRYSSYGLTVISVHRSKHSFAQATPSVAEAVERLGIRHPVVNDVDGDVASEYGRTRALDMFLVDSAGMVRAVKGGKGSAEAMQALVCGFLSSTYKRITCSAPTADAGSHGKSRLTCQSSTKEIELGRGGSWGLSALQSYTHGSAPVKYTDLSHVSIQDGVFVLSGDWASHKDGVAVHADKTSGMVDTHLRLRYHAKELFALMGLEGLESPGKMCADGVHGTAAKGAACAGSCTSQAGTFGLDGRCDVDAQGAQWGGCTPCSPLAPVKVYVHMDGEPVPRLARGRDCQEDALGRTFVVVDYPRIYSIVAEKASRAHSLALIPAAPGVAVHRFDFASNCSPAFPAV